MLFFCLFVFFTIGADSRGGELTCTSRPRLSMLCKGSRVPRQKSMREYSPSCCPAGAAAVIKARQKSFLFFLPPSNKALHPPDAVVFVISLSHFFLILQHSGNEKKTCFWGSLCFLWFLRIAVIQRWQRCLDSHQSFCLSSSFPPLCHT